VGKTPEEIAEIKVLDPACGSGSFLIGAYSYLLRYHLDWYTNNKPKKHKEAVFQVKENEWYLTTAEKKRILLDNVFGVDIDSQAVEVTKMSLLLKVLEHESRESIDQQVKLGLEGVLPNLNSNIKCGNSLIGPEYYDLGQQESLFDEDEMRRVNVFDWDDDRKGFGGIMKRGGFDCVIGNPPYVRIQRLSHDEIDYFFKYFEAAKKKVDISVLFIEKSLKLLNENGLAGFISTSQWVSTDYGEGLRKILSKGYLEKMIDFGSLPVFHKVSTYPAIFILSNKKKKYLNYVKIQKRDLLNLKGIESTKPIKLFYKILSHDRWILGGFDLNRWIEKKDIMSEKLGTYGHFYIGALTGMDKVFVLKADDAEKYRLEKDILIPYAYRGEEIGRYNEVSPNSVIIYPYKEGEDGNAVLMQESELKKYKNVYRYLLKNKGELMRRKDSRKEYARGRNWYRFLRPGRFTYIKPEKLIIKGVAKEACVGLLEKNIAFNGANCPAFIIDRGNIYYLIGILNSKLITQYLRSVCPAKLQHYRRFNANNLNEIPIRTIDFTNPAEKAQHDKLLALVESMLELQKKYHETRMDLDKELYERQIKIVDAQIDGLVYDLYGLTEEEIRIVEEE
jgi:hypothetical protein